MRISAGEKRPSRIDGASILSSIKKILRIETAPVNTESPASMQRSTEDLRHTLIDLVHGEMKEDMLRRIAADPSDTTRARNNMSLGVTLTNNKIERLQRDTMLAILKAAEHPGYFIANALRKDSGMAENETQVRDVALFFDVLRKSGTEPSYYGTALSRLRSITKADDLALLMHSHPEYARSALRLVLHFTTKFGGPLDMDPALRAMIKEAPEAADDIISYAEHRGIGGLESITHEALVGWQNTTTPLRDGAL
jgi:hypothetical protein